MSTLSRRSFVQLASASAAFLPAFVGAADAHILVPASVCGRWGFLNERFEFEIKPQYKSVFGFASDLAAVQLNGKWGYIDTTGQFVIQPTYLIAGPFRHGIAQVVVGDISNLPNAKHAYVDKTGNYIWGPN